MSGDMMMPQYFYFSSEIKDLLIKNLNVTGTGGILGACAVLVCLAVIFEGIKFLREVIMLKASDAISTPSENTSLNSNALRNSRLRLHTSQTLLHVTQVTLGYILMLCVMTFNVWLGLAVVGGVGLGYFMFASIVPTRLMLLEEEQQLTHSRWQSDTTSMPSVSEMHDG